MLDSEKFKWLTMQIDACLEKMFELERKIKKIDEENKSKKEIIEIIDIKEDLINLTSISNRNFEVADNFIKFNAKKTEEMQERLEQAFGLLDLKISEVRGEIEGVESNVTSVKCDKCKNIIKSLMTTTGCYDCRVSIKDDKLTTDTERLNFIEAHKASLLYINESWVLSSNSTKSFLGKSARQVIDLAINGGN
jgi:hypothetical protein